jgi:hypothetical protein
MAAAYPRAGSLWAVMRESMGSVLAPSAGLFWILFMFYQPVLEALYDPTFSAPAPAVALIFAGSLTLELIGLLWIGAYAAYAAFNFWMCARR